MRLVRRWPTLLIVALVAAALAYGFWPRPLGVDVAPIVRGPLVVTVDEDGKTRVRERYVVSAPVAGHLLRIELEPGDVVSRGQTVLALIEPSDPELIDVRALASAEAKVRASAAAQDQAEATLARAREAFELSQTELDRAARLIERRAISQAEFDEAEHRARMAAADVRSAEFAVEVAGFELELAQAALVRAQGSEAAHARRRASLGGAASASGESSAVDMPAAEGRPHDSRASRDLTLGLGSDDDQTFRIVSPVDGCVLRVFQESAGVVGAGTTLLELGDPRDIEIEVDVLSTDAVQIAPGAAVAIEHWGGGQTLSAIVRLVEPSAFLKISALGVEEQRVNVVADFVDPLAARQTLGDGYRVEARIVVWQEDDVVVAPASALFRHQGNWAVFQAVDGAAALRTVDVGQTNGLETQIVSGLEPGDNVIIHPSDQLSDGAAVAPRDESLHRAAP